MTVAVTSEAHYVVTMDDAGAAGARVRRERERV
jgi:hypothetical protein